MSEEIEVCTSFDISSHSYNVVFHTKNRTLGILNCFDLDDALKICKFINSGDFEELL